MFYLTLGLSLHNEQNSPEDVRLDVGWENTTDEPIFNGSWERQPTNESQRILTVSRIGYGVSSLRTSFDLYYLHMLCTHVDQ